MHPAKAILLAYLDHLSEHHARDPYRFSDPLSARNSIGLIELTRYLTALSDDDPRFDQLATRIAGPITAPTDSRIAWNISRFRILDGGETCEHLLARLIALPPE